MKNCSYCGNHSKLTREHILPNYLGKSYPEYNLFIDKCNGEYESLPVIKDVCGECNNGVLAKLDSYGVSLDKKYFKKIIEKPKRILFTYDFHNLQRWLVKIIYNSARSHKLEYVNSLQKFTPYILDQSKITPFPTNLLVGIIKPLPYGDQVLHPKAIVIDNWLDQQKSHSGFNLLWSVSFNSYCFVFISWENDMDDRLRNRIVNNQNILKEYKKIGSMRKEIHIPKGFIFPRHYAKFVVNPISP